MEVISKELFSEALGKNILDAEIINNEVHITFEYVTWTSLLGIHKRVETQQLNIWQIAHELKEWAWEQDYVIESCRCFTWHNDYKATVMLNALTVHHEYSTTEPEAIEKACQWIYDKLQRESI